MPLFIKFPQDIIFQSGAPQMRFSRIHIDRMGLQAPYTRLKSKPVTLVLNEVIVELEELCDVPLRQSVPQYVDLIV